MSIKSNILILGDSTSMTVGVEQATYPFVLAQKSCWTEGTVITNSSLPGFTSIDAVRYFRDFCRVNGHPEAVLLYLGNCDAMATEMPKFSYGLKDDFSAYLRNVFGKTVRRFSLKNKNTYFSWNRDFRQERERAVGAEIFKKNVENITRSCAERGTVMVLVKPVANRWFLPGVAKGNYLFYHYAGTYPNYSARLCIPDTRFSRAHSFYVDGKANEALNIYENIALHPAKENCGPEYSSLVINNYALCLHECGRSGEALTLLESLLSDRYCRKEIILFNKAVILQQTSPRKAEIEHAFNAAYIADQFMYRIKEQYREAIQDIADKYDDVSLIDLGAFTKEDDFVDHCHLRPEAHCLLASKICEKIPERLRGEATGQLENRMYSPEYHRGVNRGFNEYFGVYSDHDPSLIHSHNIEILRRMVTSGDLDTPLQDFAFPHYDMPQALYDAYSKLLELPHFTRFHDVLVWGPKTRSDMGRFPEFFIARIMASLNIQAIENAAPLLKLKKAGLIKSTDCYVKLLPEALEKVEVGEAMKRLIATNPNYQTELLQRATEYLACHLEAGDVTDRRKQSTILWYLRETMRFGAHSRLSMRYERVKVEQVAEVLCLALLAGHYHPYSVQVPEYLEKLVDMLVAVLTTHEKYSAEVGTNPIRKPAIRRAYSMELQGHLEQVRKLKTYQAHQEIPC